jgi:hypothetical protein
MRNFLSLFALVSLVILTVAACGTAWKAVKPSSDATPPTAAKPESGAATPAKPAKAPLQQAKGALSTPSADLARSGLPDGEVPQSVGDNLDQRAEVNQSALEFAGNFPNVKAAKTCFGKLYGGWNLDLFVARGKKITKQQYSWNGKSKEWEPVLLDKEVPQDQFEYYLNSELSDEKCFVLKK